MCNTHLTSTFLLNDSMEGEKERVKREAETRDSIQAQGKAPMKLREVSRLARGS